MFFTNEDVSKRDIKGAGNKKKQFQGDISYNQRGNAEGNRSKHMR